MSPSAEREMAILTLECRLRSCRYCEYFCCLGANVKLDAEGRPIHGTCLNFKVPHQEMSAYASCDHFTRARLPA